MPEREITQKRMLLPDVTGHCRVNDWMVCLLPGLVILVVIRQISFGLPDSTGD